MYIILAAIFFITLMMGAYFVIGLFGFKSKKQRWKKAANGYGVWLFLYSLFIIFGTGPVGERLFSSSSSPYKLPWKAGISRFVSQGNRSFTSHRGGHLYAWDFWMPIGTEILAAREGKAIRIEQDFDGIGLNSNFVLIEHADKSRAMYAHIKKGGALIRVGEQVKQGQLIAYSGMVGQTINPHLHFVVLNEAETASLAITFSDVEMGVPLAGQFYTSGNLGEKN